MNDLKIKIESASKREWDDDHLSIDERSSLVSEYRAENPNNKLPINLDDAFVAIVFR